MKLKPRILSWLNPVIIATTTISGCSNNISNIPTEGKALITNEEISFPTTEPEIALDNLNAELQALKTKLKADSFSFSTRSRIVLLLFLKTSYLGDYDQFSQILSLSEEGVRRHTLDPKAYLLRARAYSAVHRFEEAEQDAQHALRLGASADTVNHILNVILQATGKDLENVLHYRQQQNLVRDDFESFVMLAGIESDLGLFAKADKHFQDALNSYRDVSPFPVAHVLFQRGLMWSEKAGDSEKGAYYYNEAIKRLPQYVVANIHLAEIELETRNFSKALERMKRVESSRDPEVAAITSDIYNQLNDEHSAAEKYVLADRRYRYFLSKHRFAFLDHASEFYMQKKETTAFALSLAEENLQKRPTERSYSIALQAANAADDSLKACQWAREVQTRSPQAIPLKKLLTEIIIKHRC